LLLEESGRTEMNVNCARSGLQNEVGAIGGVADSAV